MSGRSFPKNLGGPDTGLFLARSNDLLSVWHKHDRNRYGNLHFRRELPASTQVSVMTR